MESLTLGMSSQLLDTYPLLRRYAPGKTSGLAQHVSVLLVSRAPWISTGLWPQIGGVHCSSGFSACSEAE